MHKTKLGASTLEVSRVCLGTMTFGEQNSEAQAHSQLDYALERGINFIDTAEMYPVMPRAQTQGGLSATWLVAEKERRRRRGAGLKVAANAAMHWIRSKNNLDAVNIARPAEASLTACRPNTSTCISHWPSRNVPVFGASASEPAKERACVAIEARWACWRVDRRGQDATSACPTKARGA